MNRKSIVAMMAMCMMSATPAALAEVTLPSLISDGMVIQRDAPVKIWGTASPGEDVNVKMTRKGKNKINYSKTVTAGADGKWIVEFPAVKPGNPVTVNVNDRTVNDVLVGDVLLCSGQSNMELPVARVTDMFADEIASYSNPAIRQFIVPKEFEFHQALDDTPTSSTWRMLDRENVMGFSALAYFTAKDLYENNGGVPVGIINSSWGGTPVEAWISKEYLADYPMALNELAIYEDDGYRARIKKLEGENYVRWNKTIDSADPGLGQQKWYAADLDDSSWLQVDMLSADWATDGLNPINGSHWFRKDFEVLAHNAGKEAVVRMGCIVDADSVYVNGVFVGTTGYQYPPRIYKVPAGVLKPGKNNVTVRLISQNGKPHFVAEKPYKIIFADGSETSLAGNWRYRTGTRMPHGPGMEFWCYKPTALYNSMISPLRNAAVKGVVWYQGESNVGSRNQYAGLLKTMIANWRETFADPDMPFYIVELADFLHKSDRGGRAAWAEMRVQQAKVAEDTPGAVLIRNSDLGEWNDIHPLDKKTLGQRVSTAIRKQ